MGIERDDRDDSLELKPSFGARGCLDDAECWNPGMALGQSVECFHCKSISEQ